MSLIIILLGYYFDFKSNKKQFLSDLRAGIQLVSLLTGIVLIGILFLKLSLLLSIICTTGVILPLVIMAKQLFKKK